MNKYAWGRRSCSVKKNGGKEGRLTLAEKKSPTRKERSGIEIVPITPGESLGSRLERQQSRSVRKATLFDSVTSQAYEEKI